MPPGGGAAASPTTEHQSIWCGAINSEPPLARAGRELCAGNPRLAAQTLASLLPGISKLPASDRWLDFGRAYFYALLASGQDAKARAFLTQYETHGGTEPWTPAADERAFLDRKYADAYAGFIAEDGSYPRSPDARDQHHLDPHLPAALARLRAGDVAGAIREQSQAPDEGSLYTLMFGTLYARAGDWRDAYEKWLVAAAESPPDMIDAAGGIGASLDHWNCSALEFIYYFRAHAPDRKQ